MIERNLYITLMVQFMNNNNQYLNVYLVMAFDIFPRHINNNFFTGITGFSLYINKYLNKSIYTAQLLTNTYNISINSITNYKIQLSTYNNIYLTFQDIIALEKSVLKGNLTNHCSLMHNKQIKLNEDICTIPKIEINFKHIKNEHSVYYICPDYVPLNHYNYNFMVYSKISNENKRKVYKFITLSTLYMYDKNTGHMNSVDLINKQVDYYKQQSRNILIDTLEIIENDIDPSNIPNTANKTESTINLSNFPDSFNIAKKHQMINVLQHIWFSRESLNSIEKVTEFLVFSSVSEMLNYSYMNIIKLDTNLVSTINKFNISGYKISSILVGWILYPLFINLVKHLVMFNFLIILSHSTEGSYITLDYKELYASYFRGLSRSRIQTNTLNYVTDNHFFSDSDKNSLLKINLFLAYNIAMYLYYRQELVTKGIWGYSIIMSKTSDVSKYKIEKVHLTAPEFAYLNIYLHSKILHQTCLASALSIFTSYNYIIDIETLNLLSKKLNIYLSVNPDAIPICFSTHSNLYYHYSDFKNNLELKKLLNLLNYRDNRIIQSPYAANLNLKFTMNCIPTLTNNSIYPNKLSLYRCWNHRTCPSCHSSSSLYQNIHIFHEAIYYNLFYYKNRALKYLYFYFNSLMDYKANLKAIYNRKDKPLYFLIANNTSDTTMNDTSDTTMNNTSDTTINNNRSDTTMNNTSDTTMNNTSDTTMNNTSDTTMNNTSDTTMNNTSDTTMNNTSDTTMNNTSDTTMNNTSDTTMNNNSDTTMNNNSDTTMNNTSDTTMNNTSDTTMNNNTTIDNYICLPIDLYTGREIITDYKHPYILYTQVIHNYFNCNYWLDDQQLVNSLITVNKLTSMSHSITGWKYMPVSINKLIYININSLQELLCEGIHYFASPFTTFLSQFTLDLQKLNFVSLVRIYIRKQLT